MATKKKATKKAPRAPVRYSSALAERICEDLKAGLSLNALCQKPSMPAESSVREWVMDDKDGFSAKYTRAREIGYGRLGEEIMTIADTPMIGTKSVSKATGLEITEGDMIEHRRLQVETRKWMLSKMLPKLYGDKQQIELSGSVDIAGAMLAARKRAGKA